RGQRRHGAGVDARRGRYRERLGHGLRSRRGGPLAAAGEWPPFAGGRLAPLVEPRRRRRPRHLHLDRRHHPGGTIRQRPHLAVHRGRRVNRLNPRLLIPVGAGVLVLLIWFAALWGPQGSALSKAKRRAETAEQQRDTLQDQLKRLRDSKREEPLKRSQLETLRVAVPDDPNLAQLILDANDAASRSGIDFLSITPSLPTASSAGPGSTVPGGGSATPIPIRIGMTVAGGYLQALEFV